MNKKPDSYLSTLDGDEVFLIWILRTAMRPFDSSDVNSYIKELFSMDRSLEGISSLINNIA